MPEAPAPLGADIVSQLERAARLHERGVLSDQEFADLKQRLLRGSVAPPSTPATPEDPAQPGGDSSTNVVVAPTGQPHGGGPELVSADADRRMPAILLVGVTAFLAGGVSTTRSRGKLGGTADISSRTDSAPAGSTRPGRVPAAMATPKQPPQQENKPAQPHTPPPDAESLRPAQPHVEDPPATGNGGGGYGNGGTSGGSPPSSDETGAAATPGSGDDSSDQPPGDNNPDEDPEKSGPNTMVAFFVLAIPFVAGAIAAIASLPLWAIILGVVLAVGAVWALLYPDQFQKMIEDAARAAGVGLDRLKELMGKWFSQNKPSDTPRSKVPKPGSDKERATNVPNFAKGKPPREGESGKDYARRLMDEEYGEGNWDLKPEDTGPRSEYSKIKKYGDRAWQDPPKPKGER
ncbi:hypothetical protein ACFWF7_16610 [Nocardia sp. NPDC060256]|uniref:hypothetical protein n=1 Tax=unclassified Nocardia TaxID=2637762 RepID=UPI0036631B9D